MAYQVTVDEYSVLSIGGAYVFVQEDNTHAAKQSFMFQFARMYTQWPSLYFTKLDGGSVFPLFNVVIKLDKGKVTEVVWDNDCFSCLTSPTCYSEQVSYAYNPLSSATYK